MASPVLTLGPQEAKKAPGATFIMEIGFRAKKKKRAAKDRISTTQSVSLAESAKRHATRKSKFRRPSRYLLRTEKIATENKCSNATPVDVSALQGTQRESDPATRKNYQKG